MTDTPKPAAAAQPFDLHAGALRLGLRPDLGGCITGLWHGATPILRSAEPAALATSRAGAAYPLVPYSNRVAYATFRWQGRDYTTRPNFDASPHSVHGVGWQRPWQVVSSGAQELVIRLVHPGDADWPFAFEATQHFTLTAEAMTVRMVFTNTAAIAQPVGLGWHPYFVKRAQSHLQIELTERWDSDAAELPAACTAQPGIDSAVAQLDYDNCFDGWRGAAHIRDEKFALRLSSSLTHLVIYTPQTKPYFCVEPVSHVSNAIHMADPAAQGLRTVAPGDGFEASMTLEVAAL
jgi:aldose 1-epimerase